MKKLKLSKEYKKIKNLIAKRQKKEERERNFLAHKKTTKKMITKKRVIDWEQRN